MHVQLLFFSILKDLIKKTNHVQKQFFKDLVFYIAKGYYPLSFIENIWLKRVCPSFLSKQQFANKVMPNMVKKTMELYVLHTPLLK
jgi:hypothetical protein